MVSPIISVINNKVVGTISIDCVLLNNKQKQSFEEHEISFYQVTLHCTVCVIH